MNQRIKQLAEEHGFIHEYMTIGERNDALTKYQEFAKLIVKECMDLALAEQKRYANLNITHINMAECAVTVSNFRLLMKEHFGVEE